MDITVGAARITNIVEQDLHNLYQLLPDAKRDAVREIDWLVPNFAAADGTMLGLIQAMIVELDGKTLVVDCCIGDHKNIPAIPQWTDLQTGFLERFRTAGFDPNGVDYVLCTHMHMDHVGWNTYYDGAAWKPTFPNARYLFARDEMHAFMAEATAPAGDLDSAKTQLEALPILLQMTDAAILQQSVQPILDAGLAELVDVPHTPLPGVTLVPTPGHTAGHVSIRIESQGASALITGDSFHHPCQIARPDWASIADADTARSSATRKQLLAEHADTPTLIIGTHFCEPVYGRIVESDDGYRFDF